MHGGCSISKEGDILDWFDAFIKERDSLTLEIDGEEVPVNDCPHCIHFKEGKYSEPCGACKDAALFGCMNMCWGATKEAFEMMREFKEQYESRS